ncbi:endopeptidase La [candidate division WOR-3 bacterium]|nr:endopeptidase La [candidate division WOR-3 bacterium]
MNGKIPKILPVLTLEDQVIFPYMVAALVVKDTRSIKLVEETYSSGEGGNKMIGTFALKSPHLDERDEHNFYWVGTASKVLRMLKFPDGTVRIIVQGARRIRIKKIIEREPYMRALIEPIKKIRKKKSLELEAIMRQVSSTFQKIVQLAPYLQKDLQVYTMNISSGSRLADLIGSNLNLNLKEKQELLELCDPKEKLTYLIPLLSKEENILELSEKIRTDVKTELGKTQREYFLREQLKAIKKELGEKDERTMEISEFKKKIEAGKLPKEAKEVAYKEIDRLEHIPPAAAEYTVCRTYLDWLTSLPWEKETTDNLDIIRAQKILDEDHYDLEDVKERILEYLAVRKLKPDSKGPILCFVGPPGVGKTSLGMSIARALGRKFVRFSLGGVRDEAEIRGHRRTYVGALPGRIIQGIKRANSRNPVFMLDEIDKIGMDFRGDPAAALLEALDPEQNKYFSDHYLDVVFDLSKVMFITTANVVDPILPALKDRMEIINLPGYILEEKLKIAKNFLIPRQIKENGLTSELIRFTDGAIREIIQDYTREAGVRNVEREIANCARKVAKRIAKKRSKKLEVRSGKWEITRNSVSEFLGPPKFFSEIREKEGEIGVATGLAYSPDGGTIIFIEATKMKGKHQLNLTGKLGDIMKESAQAGLSWVRSKARNLGIKEDFFEHYDIHIHVPEGAIPKDGPSAGIAIVTALVSLLRNKKVNASIGMTGEITLRGKILPVGGIREKVIAAKRAGIQTIILPDKNRKDLIKIPFYVKRGLKFKFVKEVEEAINLAIEE